MKNSLNVSSSVSSATEWSPSDLVKHEDRGAKERAWRLSVFIGRLGEISGSSDTAGLTLAFRLVLEAQRLGEPVAWVSLRGSGFYPPDVDASAVDLESLIVVWVERSLHAALAADQLVRSGGFGLVVLDLGLQSALPIPVQARLTGLAQKHHAAIVCLTDKEDHHPSIGSLISIRAEAVRGEKVHDRYLCQARVVKDKRGGPGWKSGELCHGPAGLY